MLGVFWGSFAQRQPQDNAANFQQLFGWFAEGKLKPLVSQVYPLSNAAQAINDLGSARRWARWWCRCAEFSRPAPLGAGPIRARQQHSFTLSGAGYQSNSRTSPGRKLMYLRMGASGSL